MKPPSYDTIDWSDDSEPKADASPESTLWGETRISDAIHEANQQQLDPEQYIKDKKKGIAENPVVTEFRTVYQKPKKSMLQRLRNWIRRS